MKVPLDQILFRTRGVLATLWVLLLLFFSYPWISVWSALLFIPGLLIRFWAAGFIGPVSRKPSISVDHLATRGPYSLTRHPLYLGNALLVAAGLLLLRPHWILILLTGVGFLTLYILIGRAEEQRLVERYGQEYRDYKHRVTPLFPRKLQGPLFAGFNTRWALGEYQTWVVVGFLYLLTFLKHHYIPELF